MRSPRGAICSARSNVCAGSNRWQPRAPIRESHRDPQSLQPSAIYSWRSASSTGARAERRAGSQAASSAAASVTAATAAIVAGSLGVAASAGLMRLLSSLLFGIGAVDAPIYIAGAIALLAAAGVASYVLARRALAADPIMALKVE